MVELPQSQPSMMAPTGVNPALYGGQMLPSMAPNLPLLPSMDPGMSQQVATQYGQTLLQNSTSQLQELMVISGDFTATMRRNLADLTSVSSNLSQIDQILSGALQGLRQTTQQALSGSAAPSGARGSTMAPTGLTEAARPSGGDGGGPGPEDEEADTRTVHQRFTEGRSMANRQTMGQVTRRMASTASAALQSRAGTWETTPDEHGNLNFHDSQGNIVDSMLATKENIDKAREYGNRVQRASGLLGRYGSGESLLGGEGGLLGGLGEGMLKAAGPIGLAVGVADQGFKQFAAQTAAGAPYRAAYGEDAGRFAFSDRLSGLSTRVGGYFTGNPMAGQNFDAARDLGLQGDRRSQAVDFMNQQYLKLGLDTQTSAEAVQISAQNTNISLATLSDQIMKVSEAAVSAGKNSENAVQSFLAVTGQVQSGITNSAQAPVIAGNITTAVASQLPSSLNTPAMVSGLAGLAANQQNIALVAGATGQNFGLLTGQVMTGTGGAAERVIGVTTAKALDSICRAGAGMTAPELRAEIKAQFGDLTYLTPDMQMQVFTAHQHLPPIIQMVFQQYGLPVTEGDAATTFFSMLLSDITDLGKPGTKSGPKSEDQISIKGGADQILDHGALSNQGRSALGITLDNQSGPGGRGGAPSTSQGLALNKELQSADVKAYTAYAAKSGDRDKAAEAMIQKAKDIAAYTGKDLSEVEFTMPDKSTKTFAEILQDKSALAEFDKGTPYVHSGSNKNDIKDVKDFIPDAVTGGTTSAGDTSGKSVQAGGYTFTLTGDAARMFNLTGPSDSQSQGVPPSGSSDPNGYTK